MEIKKIISCSWDKTVKIWEEKYDGYKNIQTLTHSNKIYSMLLLENKNVLISGGIDGTKLWKLSNFDLIYHFQQTVCGNINALCRINEDLIIAYASKNNRHSLKILSISQKSIIKEISYPFFYYGI
jgi:WD40 repeat protein